MKIFSDERLINLGIISGTVSKDAGNMRDKENVIKFFKNLNIPQDKILGLKQVHGDKIISLLTPQDLAAYKAQQAHEADGWLLGLNNCGVMILTADCVPLYLWDSQGKYISLCHCGWRGVAAGLPQKAGQLLLKHAGKEAELCAYIGPHINPCCFEVQQDVAQQFAPSSVIKRDGKLFVDLTADIIRQLKTCGVKIENIKNPCSCECTCCNKELFFSYRREHTKDAMLSFVYKL